MEGEEVEFTLLTKRFGSPAVLLGRNFEVAQDGADVDCLAVVAAVVFAEFFHAGNFTQRRENAKRFLTRIARINTDSIFKSPQGWHLYSWRIKRRPKLPKSKIRLVFKL